MLGCKQGVHDNQNDANYGAGNYRPHKNSHHHDNWTDPNPKWNKYQKQEEKGGKGSSKGNSNVQVFSSGMHRYLMRTIMIIDLVLKNTTNAQ